MSASVAGIIGIISGISAAVSASASGAATSMSRKKARKMGKELAGVIRNDTLKQQAVELGQEKRRLDLDESRMKHERAMSQLEQSLTVDKMRTAVEEGRMQELGVSAGDGTSGGGNEVLTGMARAQGFRTASDESAGSRAVDYVFGGQ